MDLEAYEAIAGKLEVGKTAGWLSEYLVAWHGPSGCLEPEVTVWRTAECNDETVLARLRGVFRDPVPARRLVTGEKPARSPSRGGPCSMLGTTRDRPMTAPLKA